MQNTKSRALADILLVALFLSVATLIVTTPHVVRGQGIYGDESIPSTGAGGFVPLESFEGSGKLTDAYKTEELGPFMNKVFVGAISLGAILAVLRLAWAGFSYMSSDLWSTKEKSKEIIQDTLLGLFLLLAIWLILRQINPQILDLRVTAQPPNSFIANQPTDI